MKSACFPTKHISYLKFSCEKGKKKKTQVATFNQVEILLYDVFL